MNHAFLGSKPPQLRIGREAPPERREVGGDVLETLTHDEMPEGVDRRRAHFVAAADRERQAVAFDAAVGAKHDVRRRIIGIGMHRVGAGMRTRRREPEVEDVQVELSPWSTKAL